MGAPAVSDCSKVVMMQDRKEESQALDLGRRLEEAYREAYPGLEPARARHKARNLTQILAGVIDISERLGQPGEITQAEIAAALVYWCASNTYLEELREGRRDPALCDPASPGISAEEAELILSEFSANAADMLLAMDVLRQDERLLAAFVRGTAALGAPGLATGRTGARQ